MGYLHIMWPRSHPARWSDRHLCHPWLVTDHNSPRFGGQPLPLLLRRSERELVTRILQALVAEIPVYARLPRELVEGDVRRVVTQALRMYAASIPDGGSPQVTALERLSASAERRAEEGVPMSMVMTAYFRGSHIATEWAMEQATPEEIDSVRQTASTLIIFLEHAAAAVASGYARHSEGVLAEQASTRQVLTHALVEGDVAAQHQAAARAGIQLPAGYVAVAIHAGLHPDEGDESRDRAVATRRKVRRIRDELQRHFPEPVLWQAAEHGGLALVPVHDPDDHTLLRAAFPALEKAAGAPLHAGIAGAVTERVAAAATIARDVLGVALQFDLPAGAYDLDEVAVEYQLTRPSPALDVLGARLAALEETPELARTLEVYIGTGLRRRQTAQEMGVHPNTVDNRLRRVATTTGLDPARPEHLPTIRAALAARSTRSRGSLRNPS